MAIQKSKTLPNGATGNYWKITKESCDRLSLRCVFEITLFTDKAHADNGSPSLGLSKSFTFTCTKQELAGDLTALGYAKIKAKADSLVTEPCFDSEAKKFLPKSKKFDSDLADAQDA